MVRRYFTFSIYPNSFFRIRFLRFRARLWGRPVVGATQNKIPNSFNLHACLFKPRLLQGEEGTLSSPKSPRLGLECEWTLRAPQGQTVEVYFTETPV